jgi:WD40 repeat protein
MGKTLLFSTRKRDHSASMVLSLLAILLFSASACAPRYAPSVAETALHYNPVRIASGVPARPGSLTWSPDGTRLAFIGKTLKIYDTGSGMQRSFPIDNPYYVVWAPDSTLYALSRDSKGNSVLCSLDTNSSRIEKMTLDLDADALYPASDGKNLLILSIHIKALSFGTRISCILALRNMAVGSSKTIYSFEKTYMMKNLDNALLTAWTHAGPSPLDNVVLVMEHVRPPVLPFYTKVNSLDLATGEISEMSNPTTNKIYLSASWSPDGRRAVLTDGNGRIEVRDRLGKGAVIDWSLTGMYPSWNPRGSRIYCGGFLIDSDGKNKEELLTNAAGSISQWSPDGITLAVATGDGLLLFRNMPTSYVLPDRPLDKALSEKLSLLRKLLSEGVISPQEYNERRDNLTMKPEEGK